MNYKVGAMVVEQGITPCILPGGNRKQGVPYRKRLGKKGHGIESLFAKIEDWRPIASRQDRCAPIFIFPSAVLLAATLFFCFSLLILESSPTPHPLGPPPRKPGPRRAAPLEPAI